MREPSFLPASSSAGSAQDGSAADTVWEWSKRKAAEAAASAHAPHLRLIHALSVMRGLPRIHLVAKKLDCRVKPGNDDRD
jgi:hypothetical protein